MRPLLVNHWIYPEKTSNSWHMQRAYQHFTSSNIQEALFVRLISWRWKPKISFPAVLVQVFQISFRHCKKLCDSRIIWFLTVSLLREESVWLQSFRVDSQVWCRRTDPLGDRKDDEEDDRGGSRVSWRWLTSSRTQIFKNGGSYLFFNMEKQVCVCVCSGGWILLEL